jgi:transposase
MSQKRRQFTREFKLEALRLAEQEGMTASRAAEQLGVNREALYRWKREFSSEAQSAFRGNGKRTPDDEKMVRLERENSKLKAQIQFLKKVAGYFASGKN